MPKNSSAKYYGKTNKGERYQDVSEDEKNRKQQYGSKRYKNLTGDEKWKLLEYRKKYKIWKKQKMPHKQRLKNSKTIFKTYLKWRALTFLCKYKKFVF